MLIFNQLLLSCVFGVQNNLPVWPDDFTWSSAGKPTGYNCIQITEGAEPYHTTWWDNYFCWRDFKRNPGFQWSSAGPISNMRCTLIREAADPHTWLDNYLCERYDSPYKFSWSSAGKPGGKSCIQWKEGADPATWHDNWLCGNKPNTGLPNPVFPTDFRWSSHGVPSGYDCEKVSESADPHTWDDNYFCWKTGKKYLGIRWSSSGPISGKRCTRITDPKESNYWNDNYLCINYNSIQFYWSSNGQLRGKTCLKWSEGADPNSWDDNFLCANQASNLRNPVFPSDFKWSSAGIPQGYDCERIVEGADPYSWHDNYFCWKWETKIPGITWSNSGPIAGKRCTKILEPSDPHTWDDNYLCVPESSNLNFIWSWHGSYQCKNCIQWHEGADPHTWNDNWLCDDSCILKDGLDRTYNEYTWVTSHNAHSSFFEVTLSAANQYTDMYDQMKNQNVRGLMIDIRWEDGRVELTHGDDHAGVFADRMQKEVVRFLNEDPTAVLWFDIQVDGGDKELEAKDFEAAMDEIPDITNKMFNPQDWSSHNEWPTLRELINSGQRIIMVTDNWEVRNSRFTVLHRDSVVAENDWGIVDKDSCGERPNSSGYNQKNIGISGLNWSRLFTMNHFPDWKWYKTFFGINLAEAPNNNNWDGLFPRILKCKEEAGIDSFPNFLAVDYVSEGDVQEIAEVLTEGGFIFYEGNSAEQNIVCGIGAGMSRSVKGGEKGCENDEARSVRMVNLPANTRLEVFDSRDGSRSDDFSILRTTQPVEDECLDSFERDLNTNSFSSVFLRNNGLDGKVSLFKVTANVGQGDLTPLIVFYEGNGGSQNIVCTLSRSQGESLNFKHSGDCDNDEARSVKLVEVPANSEVKVYDNPNGSTGDDYTVIKVLSDITGSYIVHSFESSFSDSYVNVQFHKHNGLDGKVSRAVYSFGAH